jgi:hypothetical protein
MRNPASSIKAIARKIRTYRRFSAQERSLVRTAAALLCLARAAIWILPFRDVKSAADRLSQAHRTRGDFSELEIAWAIRVASRSVPGARCLAQALAAQVLLSWLGYASRLHIGVALEDQFEAHAWVECNGMVVVGGAEKITRYTPILVANTPQE